MKRILIVDDEPHIRALLEQTLEEVEDWAEIHLAADGEEGLQAALSLQPDLILLDVMMPKMNGYQVCAAIRERLGDGPYVIMLSAKGQVVDQEQGLAAGANEYLTKPFDPDLLIEKVEDILELDG